VGTGVIGAVNLSPGATRTAPPIRRCPMPTWTTRWGYAAEQRRWEREEWRRELGDGGPFTEPYGSGYGSRRC